jgi:hypothetical protein
MVVELLRVEEYVNCVLWCLGGSLHRAARFGDLYGNVRGLSIHGRMRKFHGMHTIDLMTTITTPHDLPGSHGPYHLWWNTH